MINWIKKKLIADDRDLFSANRTIKSYMLLDIQSQEKANKKSENGKLDKEHKKFNKKGAMEWKI